MLIKRIITILTLLSIVALHAELLIFKKTIEGFIESLTYEESLRFGPIISQIILKYQWPMCIMSDLTKEEKNELLTSGISRAEEIFIQKKLQEAIPGLDIQVAFIPTTLYEVLCLKQIIYISENDIKLKEIDFSKNVFERLAIGVIASRSHIDKYINFPRLYPKNGYLEYQFFNKMFFETMIKLCINERIPLKSNVQTMLDLVVAEDISSYMFVNNYIIQYLLVFMQKKMLGLNRVNVSNFVQTHIDEILEQLNTELKKCSLESSCLKNINSIWPHNYYFINEALLKKFITVEYLARDLNKALLFRGSSVLFGKSLQQKLIKTVQDESIKDIIGTTIQSNFERPFSISFGQSVFAGALFEGKERSAADPGACVYTFAQRMT
ncbi:hypothetical protein KAZ82_01085, partial [Candidatus Babeliales bacterium]|nr:hypothetical protein [Candidatus Babeliales bacterium]